MAAASAARHETRALLRAHLAAASRYGHLTRHCVVCHRLLRLSMELPEPDSSEPGLPAAGLPAAGLPAAGSPERPEFAAPPTPPTPPAPTDAAEDEGPTDP
ncbi:DUF6274 family protein [Streptomyces zaomyceticus]|uniref:DUF6274 family protein n=1 Tax=Streptomyces zaomyceticus TaxID=68286 RepID=UPI0037170F65